MTTLLGIVGFVTGLASILLDLWIHRGPSTSVLVARRVLPDEVLPDGSIRRGDVIELRR